MARVEEYLEFVLEGEVGREEGRGGARTIEIDVVRPAQRHSERLLEWCPCRAEAFFVGVPVVKGNEQHVVHEHRSHASSRLEYEVSIGRYDGLDASGCFIRTAASSNAMKTNP